MDNQLPAEEKKLFTPKLVFIILGIILLVEVFFALKTLSLSTSSNKSHRVPQIPEAKISLVSLNKEYKVGEVVPVSILINTDNQKAIGSDAIIHFDTKALEATPGALKKGDIFEDYPALGVDNKTGTITVSGIDSNKGVSFSGIGVLALINFKAKTPGVTNITLDFTADATTDTNLVDFQTNKDILKKIENLSLTVMNLPVK